MTAIVRIVLPWPPSELSPNARPGHWVQLRRAQKRFRDSCYVHTLEQRVRPPQGSGRYDVLMRFVRPDRRGYDRDNLVARMKAGLDGLAAAWAIDDSAFVRVAAEVDEVVAQKASSCVVVYVTEHVRGIADGAPEIQGGGASPAPATK